MAIPEADQIVTRFVAAWERADVDELLGYFAEDAVWHPIPMQASVGKAALRQAMTPWLGETGQLGAEIHLQIANGTTVMHERTDRFTLGTQELALAVAAVFEIDNGLITAWREYFDMSPFVGGR